MPPSKTAMVLRNQGDPIFGALAALAIRGVRAVRGIIKARSAARVARQTTEIVRQGQGAVGRIVRSKAARVVAEGVGFGTAAAAAGSVFRRVAGAGELNVQGEFIVGEGGCPTGKIVEVAAHQRIIPLDRFGRPRRRIDVLNTKALSRATRRLGGFQKRARRVEKQLAKIAPRSRSRRRSKGVC